MLVVLNRYNFQSNVFQNIALLPRLVTIRQIWNILQSNLSQDIAYVPILSHVCKIWNILQSNFPKTLLYYQDCSIFARFEIFFNQISSIYCLIIEIVQYLSDLEHSSIKFALDIALLLKLFHMCQVWKSLQ